VLNLPNAADVFTDLDQHLKEVNPSNFSDAESRLLAKLWNENDDIEEELHERVCNLIAAFVLSILF